MNSFSETCFMTDTVIQSNVLFIYSITMRAEDISHFKITNMPREEKNKNAHFHKTQKKWDWSYRLCATPNADHTSTSSSHFYLSFAVSAAVFSPVFLEMVIISTCVHLHSVIIKYSEIRKPSNKNSRILHKNVTGTNTTPRWYGLTNTFDKYLLDIHHPQNCPI